MKFAGLISSFKYGLVFHKIILRLKHKFGVDIFLYYVLRREILASGLAEKPHYCEYTYVEMGQKDIQEIAILHPGRDMSYMDIRKAPDHIAAGLKHKGKLVSYIFANTKNLAISSCPEQLGSGEVYKYDSYTVEAHRGRSLINLVGYQLDQTLMKRGFTTSIAIIEYFNTASLRTTIKRGSIPIRLYLSVSIKNKHLFAFKIKNYLK